MIKLDITELKAGFEVKALIGDKVVEIYAFKTRDEVYAFQRGFVVMQNAVIGVMMHVEQTTKSNG